MRILDLFCGCGGASEGYQQAGLEVAVAVDLDDKALASHAANHPDTEHLELDLTDPADLISMFTRGEFDAVHGSPPCVQFSQANNSPDPELGMVLIRSFEQVVEELRPTWFIMENVRPVLKYLDGLYPRKLVLNAADFGVPQIRHRAFCGKYPRPLQTNARRGPQVTLDGRRLEPWMSVREALELSGDGIVKRRDSGDFHGPMHSDIDEPSRTVYGESYRWQVHTGRDWKPDGSYQVRDAEEPAPALSTKTGGQFHLVSKHCVGGEKGTRATRSVVNTNMSGVQLWTGGGSIYSKENRAKPRSLDEPSFAVTAGVPGHFMECEPGQHRTDGKMGRQVTVEECLILQGFPQDYKVLGNKTSRYKQIGNAVPPPFTRAIGLAIVRSE